MKKSKITLIALSMILSFGLFIVFLNHADDKINAERLQREAEPIIEEKKLVYNSYMDSIDGIVGSTDEDDILELFILSATKLSEVFEDEDEDEDEDEEVSERFDKTKAGNEYLDKFREEAVRNLNLAIPTLMDTDITRIQHETISYIENSEYLSVENESILIELIARANANKEKQDLDEMESFIREGKHWTAMNIYQENEHIQNTVDGNALYYYASFKRDSYGFEAKEKLAQNINPNYNGRMSAEINEEFEYVEGVIGIFGSSWGYYYEENQKSNVYIGMTKEEVLESKWGKPRDINRTVTSYGSSEQWVYGGGQYLYFTDGVLTSFQD